jgi:RNA exonuclease 4
MRTSKQKDDGPTKKGQSNNRPRRSRRSESSSSKPVTLSSIQKSFIGPYVALDCEMVGVGPGGLESALARVSAVKWSKEEIILDTFVKVPVPVTDFRTFVSGVTPSDLESDKAMEFEECREIVQFALKGRVLVGHALSNDLRALNLEHPARDIRDTSTYVPFMHVVEPSNRFFPGQPAGVVDWQWRSRKLKDLARERLGMDIQCIGEAHSSVQDARVALRLYRLVREEWERLILWQEGRTFNREVFRGYENTTAAEGAEHQEMHGVAALAHTEEGGLQPQQPPPKKSHYTLAAWFPKKKDTSTTSTNNDSASNSSGTVSTSNTRHAL